MTDNPMSHEEPFSATFEHEDAAPREPRGENTLVLPAVEPRWRLRRGKPNTRAAGNDRGRRARERPSWGVVGAIAVVLVSVLSLTGALRSNARCPAGASATGAASPRTPPPSGTRRDSRPRRETRPRRRPPSKRRAHRRVATHTRRLVHRTSTYTAEPSSPQRVPEPAGEPRGGPFSP